MYCWNLQCVAHNLIHNPFFTSDWLNRVFYLVESLCLGAPHILNHHYHVAHHIGDNDYKGPDGTTKDWSSIYRYGEGKRPESFWRYSLIGYFRAEIVMAMKKVIRHGRPQIVEVFVEFLAIGAMWLFMLLYNWKYFVYFYLPSYYLAGCSSTPRATWSITALSRVTTLPIRSVVTTGSTTFLRSTTATTRSTTGIPRPIGRRKSKYIRKSSPNSRQRDSHSPRAAYHGAIEDWWNQRQLHNKLGEKRTQSQTAT